MRASAASFDGSITMSSKSIAMPFAVSVLAGALMLAPAAQAQSRGELLYSTHCIACHTTQMHWRDKKLVTDWSSLKAQVRRWQGAANLQWSDDDIVAVTRHLNERIYRFEQTSDRLSSLVPAGTSGKANATGTAIR
jgi:mono/diheme cytochrome c family protein